MCPTPFFQRRIDQPAMTSTDIPQHHPDNQSTTSSNLTEPLPVYVPPDAPPPKYENAIVNQIREDRAWPQAQASWYDGLEQGAATEASGSEMQEVTPPPPSRSHRLLFNWR